MSKQSYFVCYSVKGAMADCVVEIEPVEDPKVLVMNIRNAVWPERPGDPSDGLRPQRSADCVLVNFFRL